MNFVSSQLLLAKTVVLTEARNLRDVEGATDPDAPLALVGRLGAGTQIEIPDDYCVFNADGKFDFDASVKKWMQAMNGKDGKQPDFAKFNDTQKDYFIPITVSKAAPGSKIKNDGKFTTDIPTDSTFYISIRNVGVALDSSMKTTDATGLYAKPKAKSAPLEAKGSTDTCTNCGTPDTGLNDLRKQAVETAASIAKTQKSPPLAKTKKVAASASTADGTLGAMPPEVIEVPRNAKRDNQSTPLLKAADAAIVKKFSDTDTMMQKTCGFGLNQFLPEIQRQTNFTPFSPSELISIMSHESSGNCFPKNKAIKDSMEHGLFGVTNSDGKIAQNENFCGVSNGIDTRKGVMNAVVSGDSFARLSAYATDPKVHCVGNPFLNLQASIRNLNEKLTDYLRRNPRAKILDSSGKLTDEGFKSIAELYAGQGMKSYGNSTSKDAVKLDRLLSDYYTTDPAQVPPSG